MIRAKTDKEVMQELINRTNSTHTHLVGVDPDVDKNGVCLYERKTKEFTLHNLTFFQLFDFLIVEKQKGIAFKVVIEAGWYNLSNWHVKVSDNARIVAKKGNSLGSNHETGRKIVEMCEYLKLEYQLVKPTAHKVKSDTFRQITGYTKRTNPEQRDATMLVYGM